MCIVAYSNILDILSTKDIIPLLRLGIFIPMTRKKLRIKPMDSNTEKTVSSRHSFPLTKLGICRNAMSMKIKIMPNINYTPP
jgi:hypothetical protein